MAVSERANPALSIKAIESVSVRNPWKVILDAEGYNPNPGVAS